MFYLTDTDPHPEGYGAAERGVGSYGGSLRAIDYKTGKTVWNHQYPSGGGQTGILTTPGKLLFAGDGEQHLLAFDPADGNILGHAGLADKCNEWAGDLHFGRAAVLSCGCGRFSVRVYA